MATSKPIHKKLILIFLASTLILLTTYRIISLWNGQFPDFSVYYFSAKGITHGINPYKNSSLFTGFGYPPFTTLLFIPFIFLSYTFAQRFFLVINIVAFLACISLSLFIFKKLNLKNFLVVTILASLSFPVKFTLGMGQSNFFSLFFLLLGYFYLIRKNLAWSGFYLFIAMTIKPLFAFVLIFFLLKRQYKVLITCVSLLIAIILISIILFGINNYVYYIATVVPHLAGLQGREIYYSQGITGFVARLTSNLEFRKIYSTLFSIGAIFLLIVKSFKKISNHFLFSLTFVVLTLIDSLAWQHHFVFLLFPFIFLFFQIQKQKKQNKILFLFLAISYILVSLNIPSPQVFKSFPANLLLSHVFYAAVIVLIINLKVKGYEK